MKGREVPSPAPPPARRYTLANPAHSPYGARSFRVSSSSAQRPLERRAQLDQTQVADEAMLEASETVQADDAGRPGTEATLALDSGTRLSSRDPVQALQVELTREPDKRGRLAADQSDPGQLGRREAREGGASRWQPEPLMLLGGDTDQLCLEEPCRPGLDQLPTDRLQERVRDRGDPQRAHAAEGSDPGSEQ